MTDGKDREFPDETFSRLAKAVNKYLKQERYSENTRNVAEYARQALENSSFSDSFVNDAFNPTSPAIDYDAIYRHDAQIAEMAESFERQSLDDDPGIKAIIESLNYSAEMQKQALALTEEARETARRSNTIAKASFMSSLIALLLMLLSLLASLGVFPLTSVIQGKEIDQGADIEGYSEPNKNEQENTE